MVRVNSANHAKIMLRGAGAPRILRQAAVSLQDFQSAGESRDRCRTAPAAERAAAARNVAQPTGQKGFDHDSTAVTPCDARLAILLVAHLRFTFGMRLSVMRYRASG